MALEDDLELARAAHQADLERVAKLAEPVSRLRPLRARKNRNTLAYIAAVDTVEDPLTDDIECDHESHDPGGAFF